MATVSEAVLKNIPEFNGSSNQSIHEHLQKLELRKQAYKYDDDKLLQLAKLTLGGAALAWCTSSGPYVTYDSFRDGLIAKFAPLSTPERAFTKLLSIEQNGSACRDYINKLDAAKHSIVQSNGTVSDEIMFATLIRGLDKQYKKIISMLDITDYDEACIKILNMEAIDITEKTDATVHTMQFASSGTTDDKTPAVDSSTADKKATLCFECHSPKHLIADCPTRKLQDLEKAKHSNNNNNRGRSNRNNGNSNNNSHFHNGQNHSNRNNKQGNNNYGNHNNRGNSNHSRGQYHNVRTNATCYTCGFYGHISPQCPYNVQRHFPPLPNNNPNVHQNPYFGPNQQPNQMLQPNYYYPSYQQQNSKN